MVSSRRGSQGRESKNDKCALHDTHTRARLGAQLLSDDRNGRRLVPRGRLQGERAIMEGFLEEEGLVQGKKRTGTFEQGRGRQIHCTRQTQSLMG